MSAFCAHRLNSHPFKGGAYDSPVDDFRWLNGVGGH